MSDLLVKVYYFYIRGIKMVLWKRFCPNQSWNHTKRASRFSANTGPAGYEGERAYPFLIGLQNFFFDKAVLYCSI